MTNGMITALREGRISDRITALMHNLKLFRIVDRTPIIEDKTGKTVGYFVSIYGSFVAVRFLEAITNIRGKNTISWDVRVNEIGKIIEQHRTQ